MIRWDEAILIALLLIVAAGAITIGGLTMVRDPDCEIVCELKGP